MNEKEIESKQRFIELLILISSIIIAVRGINIDLLIFVLFLVFSVFYYVVISNEIIFRKLQILFLALMTSIFFSATLATAIGIATPSEPFKSINAILYYIVLIILLTISLNNNESNRNLFEKLKSVLNVKNW